MTRSFYIVPTHNKDFLIESVLNGILSCHNAILTKPIIVCLVDGCTDNTKEIVTNFKNKYEYSNNINIIYLNDVHEIKCLNSGLDFIKNNFDPKDDDLIFMIQDDIILQEEDINIKFDNLFRMNKNLGYVSLRLGVSVEEKDGDLLEYNFIESEFGHWKQLNWNFHNTLNHLEIMPVEIAVRSPTCTLWKRFKDFGFFDENLAPFGFDCHEFSIRMNKASYINAVIGFKFKSDVQWGTMRKGNPSFDEHKMSIVHKHNKDYILKKHKDYFNKKNNQSI